MVNAKEKEDSVVLGLRKVTCSGSFRSNPSTDKDRKDFEGVEVIIPKMLDVKDPEQYVIQHTMRMFPIAKSKNKKLEGESFHGLIKIYIDSVEDIEGIPDCCGKSLKTLTWEELQSLACMMNFREIPLFRQGSIRAAQEKAYELWQTRVLGKRLFRQAKDISQFKDSLRRNLEALMLQSNEIEERVDEEMKKAFSMIINPGNPSESYSFSKVDDIMVPAYNPITLKETKK